MRRSGQIVVSAVLLVAVFVMLVLVMVYQAHSLFLQTRTPVVRETVASITGDFARAVSTILAVHTRAKYNYTRFPVSAYKSQPLVIALQGYSPDNDTSVSRAFSTFLELWRLAALTEYGDRGLNLVFETPAMIVGEVAGQSNPLILWNTTNSLSYIYGVLRLNLTQSGFYNWESRALIGMRVVVDGVSVVQSSQGAYTQANITVYIDSNIPYGYLIARGWVEVYYTSSGKWAKANITDISYQGLGKYTLKFTPAVDPAKNCIMFVVSDERGIIVVAGTPRCKAQTSSSTIVKSTSATFIFEPFNTLPAWQASGGTWSISQGGGWRGTSALRGSSTSPAWFYSQEGTASLPLYGSLKLCGVNASDGVYRGLYIGAGSKSYLLEIKPQSSNVALILFQVQGQGKPARSSSSTAQLGVASNSCLILFFNLTWSDSQLTLQCLVVDQSGKVIGRLENSIKGVGSKSLYFGVTVNGSAARFDDFLLSINDTRYIVLKGLQPGWNVTLYAWGVKLSSAIVPPGETSARLSVVPEVFIPKSQARFVILDAKGTKVFEGSPSDDIIGGETYTYLP